LFESEDHLINAFSKKAAKLIPILSHEGSTSKFFIHEFNSQFGIADLVFGTTNRTTRKQIERQPININWMFPLTTFEKNQKFTFEEFELRFSLSKSMAKKRLQEYEDSGFISQHQNGVYIVSQTYKPVTNLVISIEAKLKHWRRALLQAGRYRRFSDYSFVLLDKNFANPAVEHIEEFQLNNVGLILMEGDRFEVIYTPNRNLKKMKEYLLRLNEVVLGHLRENLKSY
jgi:hypothetical protein